MLKTNNVLFSRMFANQQKSFDTYSLLSYWKLFFMLPIYYLTYTFTKNCESCVLYTQFHFLFKNILMLQMHTDTPSECVTQIMMILRLRNVWNKGNRKNSIRVGRWVCYSIIESNHQMHLLPSSYFWSLSLSLIRFLHMNSLFIYVFEYCIRYILLPFEPV